MLVTSSSIQRGAPRCPCGIYKESRRRARARKPRANAHPRPISTMRPGGHIRLQVRRTGFSRIYKPTARARGTASPPKERNGEGSSEEVVGHALVQFLLVALLRRRLVHDELGPRVDRVADLHDGGHVAAAVAVVRRGEDRHARVGVSPRVALHDELVRSYDELERVRREELLRDVRAERVPRAPGRDAPAAALVRVRPDQVAHGPLVRDLLEAVQLLDVVDRVQRRAQPRVRAEDRVLDRRRQRQRVEERRELLPHRRVAVLPQTLVVEPVDLRDLPRLVVPADHRHARRVPRL
mmetsp:Transcript_33949/g.102280  ORF Transcript_33949/g.102280 Transcript_33949/m.102280 type:complete len:295 (-) Transcript_33949:520-1404(-)